jgi:hypothetical protein
MNLKITKAGMILKTQQIVKYKDDLFFPVDARLFWEYDFAGDNSCVD